jgi:hypothetical protein
MLSEKMLVRRVPAGLDIFDAFHPADGSLLQLAVVKSNFGRQKETRASP